MVDMKPYLKAQNSQLFKQLVERDSSSLASLREISKAYEDFREAITQINQNEFNSISVITGRALSNLCTDIIKHYKVKKLNDATPNTIKGAHIRFLAHRGGICNRLRAIASIQAAALELKFITSFSWYETLFCPGGPLPTEWSAKNISPILYLLMGYDTMNLFFEDDPCSPAIFFDKFKELGMKASWGEFHALYKKQSYILFNSLCQSCSITNRADSFIAQNLPQDFVGVHIRRTDFVTYFAEKYPSETLPSLSEYSNKIREIAVDKKFFCSTDDVNVKEYIVQDFKNQAVFTDIRHTKEALRQTSFESSLLDLYILSKSSYMIPTSHSSFSDYALLMGAKSCVP